MLDLLIRIILNLDLGYIRVIPAQVRAAKEWLNIFLTKCTEVVVFAVTYNHFHNILSLFDVLPNFPFTTSETMRDCFV